MTQPKRILYVSRRAPHGTIYAQEGLDMILIGAAFEQEVRVAFVDDGVWQLITEQSPSAIGAKDFAKGLRALEMYDVRDVYVDGASLAQRGLTKEHLMMDVTIVSEEELARVFEQQDVVLPI